MLTQEAETDVQSQPVEKQQVNNEKKLGGFTGKGFMPGKSGNPRGRKPLGITIAQHVRDIGSEIIEVRDEELTRLDAAIREAYEKARRGNMPALALLLDRGWGKPIQPVIDATKLLQEEIVKQGLNAAAINDDPTLRAILAVLGPAGEAAGAPQLGAPTDRGAGDGEEGADPGAAPDTPRVAEPHQE